MKFKVGDKVKIIDGSSIENYTGGWIPDMGKHIGETHRIVTVDNYWNFGRVSYRLDGINYDWDERSLEFVNQDEQDESAQKDFDVARSSVGSSKEDFLEVAAKVAAKCFGSAIIKNKGFMIAVGIYTAALAEELFNEDD